MLNRQKFDCDCKDYDIKIAEWNNIEDTENIGVRAAGHIGGMDLSKIDALIFDMDGTLVNSMYYWEHLTDGWFARQGMNVPKILTNELATADLRQAAELLAEKYAKEETSEDAVFAELQAAMDRHYAEDIELMPHTRELLAALAAADIPACIATMTDRPQVETMLRRHAIGEYFRFVMTTPEVGAGKDEPKIFLQAAERLGAVKERTLVVEDSRTAIKTALRAGFAVAAVRTAGYDYAEIDRLATDLSATLYYIDDFSELLPIVK